MTSSWECVSERERERGHYQDVERKEVELCVDTGQGFQRKHGDLSVSICD